MSGMGNAGTQAGALLRANGMTVEELEGLGRLLDERPASLHGETVAMKLARTWLRVRTRTGAMAPLEANKVQQLFEQRRGHRNIVLKARQLGLTTWTAARFFLKTITHPGTLTLQVAHSRESAEEIFRIVHRFLEWMPDELRDGPLATSRANARQIVFPAIDAQYRVVTAGDRNAGRGLTVQNLHCSELARWGKNPADILAGLRAALAPGAEEILESTPEGVGGCFYEEWQTAAETGMVRHFYPWWLEERYRGEPVAETELTEEERELMCREGLDGAQIGFRRQVRASFRGLARQEYAEDAERCFLASGDSVFELDAIEARMADAPEGISRRNGQMQVWLPPIEGRQYIVAADPAGGGSEGDYSAAQVVDVGTGLQCAEFAGHVGGLELAQILVDLAREYNDAVIAVERNNHGSGVLALIEQVCKYERVYYEGGRQGGQAGWLTTALSRPVMLGRLGAALVESPGCFMSRALLNECRCFVRHRDGSTGAQSGTHDDRLMAMAVALGVREQGLGTRDWGPGRGYERRVTREEGREAFGAVGLAQLGSRYSCVAGGGVHRC
jgi:hypothetical protein